LNVTVLLNGSVSIKEITIAIRKNSSIPDSNKFQNLNDKVLKVKKKDTILLI